MSADNLFREEGTRAAWLYDLLKPRASGVEVCNPRKNAVLKDGSNSDRIDANKLSEQLYTNNIKSLERLWLRVCPSLNHFPAVTVGLFETLDFGGK